MSEAEQERAAIVAWLRDCANNVAGNRSCYTWRHPVKWMRSRIIQAVALAYADAIERNQHGQ